MLRCAARRLTPAVRQARPCLAVAQCSMSSKPTLSDEAFDAKWEEYFNRPDIDSWELRYGLNELYGHDLVPEPKIINAMLRACRRLDDYPMTLRVLETVKFKTAGHLELYDFVLQECRPVMEELGVVTPEEIGLAD